MGDFWNWAFNDLRDNTTRAVLAEFLVAKAVGDDRPVRIAWDNYDVVSPKGVRIEVKASGYLQSWSQKTHSVPTFSRLITRSYDPDINELAPNPSVRADVYVFAVHCQKDPDSYDPLCVDDWEFYVVGANSVREYGSKSVGLPWVKSQSRAAVSYAVLADEIQACADRQRDADSNEIESES